MHPHVSVGPVCGGKVQLTRRCVLPTRVAALGLASGILLVLLLFCLYKVFCPKNYGQNGLSHTRRKRGDLPCDDYGYSPPETEIVPLVLRGHLMVGWLGLAYAYLLQQALLGETCICKPCPPALCFCQP